ncbi:protein of unknown function [Pseudorhizobium banfieldiae]|uniref:Uncharacterized protein n=1 Tax=Pseudorhizobium banfieldiae TaxID=1125847 RepID=L0NIQ2_9HYPH|nr:protein of unknown function [Pseudorhizobium banfieldiae]
MQPNRARQSREAARLGLSGSGVGETNAAQLPQGTGSRLSTPPFLRGSKA